MTEMLCYLVCCVVLFVLGFGAGVKFGEWLIENRLKKRKSFDIEADEHAKDWDRLTNPF